MIQPDEQYMRRALRIAALGRHASPNPMVGCVLVDRSGTIIGEGYHHRPGEPHAEINALNSAGAVVARGAAVYVNLEPCSHHGRTGPCTDALIAAGVDTVYCSMVDPDPRVSGAGVERLRAAGIAVFVGLLEAASRDLNAAYIRHKTSGRPYVVLKTASTLDGKSALAGNHERWITSDISRTATHRQFRDRCDAIIVGIGTILKDDPELTTRLGGRAGRNPLRIVLDGRARTPLLSHVVTLSQVDGKTLIAVTDGADLQAIGYLQDAGCGIIRCRQNAAGRIDLSDLLLQLGTVHSVAAVLVEGGAAVAGSFMESGLVDRWRLYVAPLVANHRDAPGLLNGTANQEGASPRTADRVTIARSGPDLRIDAYFG